MTTHATAAIKKPVDCIRSGEASSLRLVISCVVVGAGVGAWVGAAVVTTSSSSTSTTWGGKTLVTAGVPNSTVSMLGMVPIASKTFCARLPSVVAVVKAAIWLPVLLVESCGIVYETWTEPLDNTIL